MPSPCPSDIVSACGFVLSQERVVYADWLTWAGLGVIGYTLLMLAAVNVKRYRRRVRRSDEPLPH